MKEIVFFSWRLFVCCCCCESRLSVKGVRVSILVLSMGVLLWIFIGALNRVGQAFFPLSVFGASVGCNFSFSALSFFLPCAFCSVKVQRI